MAYEYALLALGDPTRRRIFERLRAGPRPVGALAHGLPVSRPAVSQHLRVLREAELVTERRDGARRLYAIDFAGLAQLRAYVEGFWEGALDAFQAAAEQPLPAQEDAMSLDRESAPAPVRKSVTVPLDAMAAFRLFTERIAAWWPLASHSVGGEDAATCAFEPRVGGRVLETLRSGGEHVWGTIRVWQPPHRLVFSWHPGRGPDTAQEIEIRFHPSGDGGTRVELDHRGWERLGADAAKLRDNYDKGWDTVFVARFGAAARQAKGS
jgi:DNA-binding transcriptional ArsR family regulator/uncharacterized protein YndB with AHSA1/START domain